MRPITNFALHAFAAAVLTAFAASSAAAQFLALGDSIPAADGAKDSREKWIEIQSWQWGRVAKIDSFTIKQGVKPAGKDGAKGGNVEFEWKVEEGESAPPAPAGGVRVASGDVDGDSRARPGASEKITVDGGRTESGQATGKRQHLPIRARTYYDQGSAPAEKRQHGWTTVSKPLDRGSVRVKVKFPWTHCTVGARYPVITLGDAANSYRLQDVTVASCGSAGDGNDGPEESITFVYGKLGAKTKVRGWEPEKKEP